MYEYLYFYNVMIVIYQVLGGNKPLKKPACMDFNKHTLYQCRLTVGWDSTSNRQLKSNRDSYPELYWSLAVRLSSPQISRTGNVCVLTVLLLLLLLLFGLDWSGHVMFKLSDHYYTMPARTICMLLLLPVPSVCCCCPYHLYVVARTICMLLLLLPVPSVCCCCCPYHLYVVVVVAPTICMLLLLPVPSVSLALS